MFQFISSLPDLLARLQRFLMTEAATLPEFIREKLMGAAIHPSPVVRLVDSCEALWAIRADLSAEGRELIAQLAQFTAMNGFHGMRERGAAMVSALCRDAGFEPSPGQQWPDADQDPAVLESMIEKAEEPVPSTPLPDVFPPELVQ